MTARKPTRAQAIAFLEVMLEALRESSSPGDVVPLVKPSDSRAGRPCPVHLRELVLSDPRRNIWRCPVTGCRERVEAA
jgi:hypothetical protein